MPVQAEPRGGQRALSAGLRDLAARINDVLHALGTQPAFALAGAYVQSRDVHSRDVHSRDVHSRDTRAVDLSTAGMHSVETSAAAHRVSVQRPRPGPRPGATGDDGAISTDHLETWRIVERAQAGDGEAFGVLYDRYFDVVYRFVYFRVSDRALAEDFTSETFLRALRRIGTITYQGRDIGAWFITIARNIVLDHMKSARNRLEITTADTIEGDERAQSTESAVMDVLASERLMQAVGQLGDEQRECVLLRFVHGFSVAETAQVMGKNDGAIKALQHRAVRKLADLIGGDLA